MRTVSMTRVGCGEFKNHNAMFVHCSSGSEVQCVLIVLRGVEVTSAIDKQYVGSVKSEFALCTPLTC